MIVIIPSSRTVTLSYLTPLIDSGARFIVVDDTHGSIKIDHPQFEVYTWQDRGRLLGPNEIAIPRGNGACRNLGFYIAWKEAEDDEIIIALDDDCVVESGEFIQGIESILTTAEKPVASGLGRHFNIFDLFENIELKILFPRGFPYSQRVGYNPWTFENTVSGNVLFNVGLWRGEPDINAIDRSTQKSLNCPDARLVCKSVIVPPGVLISACAGNIHFRRAVIPAIYQLPMPVEVMPGWGINRYGDIWGGFILKMLMDLREELMSVGKPMVYHLRVGSVEENTRKEHLGQLVNEEFLDLLDEIRNTIEPANYLDMMAQLQQEFRRSAPSSTPILRFYLAMLDQNLGAWISALRSEQRGGWLKNESHMGTDRDFG
jgi:Reversibly glycosylated polypeptide